MSHPACLTRKVNVLRNPTERIGHRCVIKADFSAVAIRWTSLRAELLSWRGSR
jgi:hypothetical protein